MSTRPVGTISVDVCEGGCGGVWFDNFELPKVDEPGAAEIRNVQRDPDRPVDLQSRRMCPRCDDQLLFRRYFSRLRRTQIDECPSCAGIWLDAGEFDSILQEVAENPDLATLSMTLNRTVAQIRSRSGM